MLCFLASFCSTAAKTFGPVWGISFPSTPWGICCCGALKVFIFMMIQEPLNTAKLHTRHFCIVCDILCSCPRLPPGALFFSFFLGWVFACVCVVLPPVQFLPPSLRREESGPSSVCMCFMVCLMRQLMLKHKPRKAFCRLSSLRPEESVPQGFLYHLLVSPFPLSGGGCRDFNYFLPSLGNFWLGG